MKEKIKELLAKTQAFGPGGETMDRYNCSLYDLEKFAELIVRECVNTLEQQYVTISDDADPEDNKTWIGAIMNTTVDGCKRRILSNFGVKE